MHDDHGLSYALLLSPPHNPTVSLSYEFTISLPHNLTISLPYSPGISFNYFHHSERQYWLGPSLQPRSSTTMLSTTSTTASPSPARSVTISQPKSLTYTPRNSRRRRSS